MTNSNPQEQTDAPTIGPGERLQAARISVGMTQADVASKMHLSSEIIDSLEENNFDDITAPIFVKGYLRSYARLVDIDEEEIIQQYANYYTDGDPPIASIRNTMPEINADDARVKWTTYIVIFVLITLLFMWWWNQYQQPAEVVSLETETMAKSGELILPQQKSESDSSIDSDSIAISDPANVATSSSSDTPVLLAEPSAATELVKDAQSSLEKISDSEMSEPVESNTDQPVVESVQQDVADSDKDLVLIVNADTWADVRDANGNKLVYDLLRSGEVIQVEGPKPYRVFFGNGYGISLKFQGKEVDLTKNIQSNNTARIRLGQ